MVPTKGMISRKVAFAVFQRNSTADGLTSGTRTAWKYSTVGSTGGAVLSRRIAGMSVCRAVGVG